MVRIAPEVKKDKLRRILCIEKLNSIHFVLYGDRETQVTDLESLVKRGIIAKLGYQLLVP